MEHELDITALRKEHYNAVLVDIRHASEGVAVARVRPDAPRATFEAGQWNFLGVGLWEPRCAGCPEESLAADEAQELQRSVYSLSGSIVAADEDRLLGEDEEDWYEFYIALDRSKATGKSGAAVGARMFALQPGARLFVGEQPQGKNTLRGVGPNDDVVFLATGTGEAPHNRMLAELLHRGHAGRIASIVTVRHASDEAYASEHERLVRMFDNYRWRSVATRDAAPGERLQAMLASGALEEHAAIALDPQRCHVFLCGNNAMVGRPTTDDAGMKSYPEPAGMIELLEQRGFASEPADRANIHFERY